MNISKALLSDMRRSFSSKSKLELHYLGIVTKMGMWLMPTPECYMPGWLTIGREEDLPRAAGVVHHPERPAVELPAEHRGRRVRILPAQVAKDDRYADYVVSPDWRMRNETPPCESARSGVSSATSQ